MGGVIREHHHIRMHTIDSRKPLVNLPLDVEVNVFCDVHYLAVGIGLSQSVGAGVPAVEMEAGTVVHRGCHQLTVGGGHDFLYLGGGTSALQFGAEVCRCAHRLTVGMEGYYLMGYVAVQEGYHTAFVGHIFVGHVCGYLIVVDLAAVDGNAGIGTGRIYTAAGEFGTVAGNIGVGEQATQLVTACSTEGHVGRTYTAGQDTEATAPLSEVFSVMVPPLTVALTSVSSEEMYTPPPLTSA